MNKHVAEIFIEAYFRDHPEEADDILEYEEAAARAHGLYAMLVRQCGCSEQEAAGAIVRIAAKSKIRQEEDE